MGAGGLLFWSLALVAASEGDLRRALQEARGGLLPLPARARRFPLRLGPQGLLGEFPDLVIGDIVAPCAFGAGKWSAVETFCQLDTGGAASRILKDSSSRSYPPASAFGGRRGEQRGVSGQAIRKDLVWLPGLALGAEELGPRVFDRVELPAGAFGTVGGEPVRAQIALDVFSPRDTLRFRFGPPEASLSLNAPPPNARLENSLRQDEAGRLLIPIGLGPERVNAVFDTGSQVSLIDEAYAKARPGRFQRIAELTVVDAAGKLVSSQSLYLAQKIRLGGHELDHAYFVGMDFGRFIKRNGFWDGLARFLDPSHTLNLVRIRRANDPSAGGSPLIPEPGIFLNLDLDGAKAAAPEPPAVILGYNLITQFDWYFDGAGGLWSVERIP